MSRFLPVVLACCAWCMLLSGGAWAGETKTEAKTEAVKPAAAKPAEKPVEKPPAKKTAQVVRFTIRGEYPEGPSPLSLFGDLQTSLSSIVERLDAAAADKNVAAVWLRIEELEVGRGKLLELRAAVARVRKAGKPVYAELTTAEPVQYLLASACDEIFMPQSGTLMLPGVRAEMTFYKGLLDKLGIEFDMLQMGRYKGAAEPFTRTSLSKPLRESIEAIVDDTYDDLATTVAADRKLKDYQVKTLVDEGLFTANAARRAKLIDQIAYADQFEESLRKKLKVDELKIEAAYKKKSVGGDFSGIGGMVKMMELLMGGKPAEKPSQQKQIAVVYAVGPIVEGKSVSDIFGDSAVGSTTLVAALKEAADNPKVAAIVLRIDSPGGSAVASDLVWRETVRIQKPIVASMSDVAGSGGYYIAMGAKKIIAAPGTVTGSIGVVGGKIVLRGLYDKVGLTTEVIARGAKVGALSSSQPFTEEERKAWTNLMQETYNQFVGKAAQGRKMPHHELEKRAQGRVYTGRMAKGLGLIDELGTLHDAIAEAKKAAGLKPDEQVDLLILPKPRSIFEQLFGGDSLAGEMDAAAPEVFKLLRQAKLWRQLLAEPTLLWMPYGVRVR